MKTINRDFHYVWFGTEAKEMNIIWYLSILSILKYCKPNTINIYSDIEFPFKGKYYETIKTYINVIHIERPTEIYGNDLTNTPLNCLSDILRAQIIYEYGGIYCDFDILWCKEIDTLLEEIYYRCQPFENFAIGEQGKNGCEGANLGIMIGEKNNNFCKHYLNLYQNYTPEIQKEHIKYMSTNSPAQLLKTNPSLGAILPYYYFHWPLYHNADYFAFNPIDHISPEISVGQYGLLGSYDLFEKNYAHHCFFLDKLDITEEHILNNDTRFTLKARPLLEFAKNI
jgi:hypothetical protein